MIEIFNHVLKNNFFGFEHQTYHQKSGTALGTPMAPTVANLFMGWLEETLLEQSPMKIDADCRKRFIDDIFILWRGTQEDLDNFITFINSLHPTIKFTVMVGR